MEQKSWFNLTDISGLFPLVTALLIVLGVTKLIIFYSFFGVNIVSYLELGEIITSFLDTIVWVVFAISLLWFHFIPEPVSERPELQTNQTSPKNAQNAYRKNIGIAVFFIIVNLFFLYISIKDWLLHNWRSLVLFILISGVVTLVTYELYKIFKKTTSLVRKKFAIASIIFIPSWMITNFFAISDYMDVKHKAKYFGTQIIFEAQVFTEDGSHIHKSDSANFFIGKTSNYLFIYHSNNNSTSIYPMSSVVEIQLKQTQTVQSFNPLRNLIGY